MRIARHGRPGMERPIISRADGDWYDLTPVTPDITPDFLHDGLEQQVQDLDRGLRRRRVDHLVAVRPQRADDVVLRLPMIDFLLAVAFQRVRRHEIRIQQHKDALSFHKASHMRRDGL